MTNRRHERALMNAAAQEVTNEAHQMVGKALEIPVPMTPIATDIIPDFDPPSPYIYVTPDARMNKKGDILLPQQGSTHQAHTGVVLISSNRGICDKGDRVLFAKLFPYHVDDGVVFVIRDVDVLGVKKFVPEGLKLAE